MLPSGAQRTIWLILCSMCLAASTMNAPRAHGQATDPKKTGVRPVQAEPEESGDRPARPAAKRPPASARVAEEPRGARPPNNSRPAKGAGQTATSRDDQSDQQDQRLPRPKPQPLRVEKLPADLEAILVEWEQRTAKFERLTGDVIRFEYNHVFQTESRGEGTFAFQAPDMGSIRIVGSKIGRRDESLVKDENDVPYKLVPANPERWISTGGEIMQIDDKAKTFLRLEIPPERRGKRIIESPLPFLFGMTVEHARSRYHLRLIKNTANQFQLEVKPRWSGDSQNWVLAYVIISRKTFAPEAVKLIAPGEELERTFRFSNVRINAEGGFLSELFGGEDPFRPKLRGYKEVFLDSSTPAAQRPDAPQKSAGGAVAGTKPTRSAGNPAPEAAGKKAPAPRK